MANPSKIPGPVKGRIVKLFKAGSDVLAIKAIVIDKFPKITTDRIKTVIRAHLEGCCDDLWAQAVKLQDGGRCVISKKSESLNAHHLIGRNNKNFRWDIDNGVTLSVDHHSLGHAICAHGSTDCTQAFAEWMAEERPEQWGWFQENRFCKKPRILKIDDLLDISVGLEDEIKYLKAQWEPDILARREVGEDV